MSLNIAQCSSKLEFVAYRSEFMLVFTTAWLEDLMLLKHNADEWF